MEADYYRKSQLKEGGALPLTFKHPCNMGHKTGETLFSWKPNDAPNCRELRASPDTDCSAGAFPPVDSFVATAVRQLGFTLFPDSISCRPRLRLRRGMAFSSAHKARVSLTCVTRQRCWPCYYNFRKKF